MFGKLIGVSLMALTQLAIWMAAFAGVAVYLLPSLVASGKVTDVNIPHLPAVVLHLLLPVLCAWLFHLRDHLRARRLDGYDDTGRRADGDARRVPVNGRPLHGFPGHPRSKLLIRFLGFDGSILFADHDDGADRFADSRRSGR